LLSLMRKSNEFLIIIAIDNVLRDFAKHPTNTYIYIKGNK